jgi:Holliday junction resolvasome RuvABC ATP-dependent DNA helicase subunit
MATEMGVRFHSIMATRIKTWNDFYQIIKNVETNDVVFIDEIHALAPKIQEQLYGVMEDFICTLEDKKSSTTKVYFHENFRTKSNTLRMQPSIFKYSNWENRPTRWILRD